jgi:hypothetical protein
MSALTKEELNALPDGTAIKVKWSGGNGPHKYTLRRSFSTPWACTQDGHWVGHLKHVGTSNLDQVWVDEDQGECWNKAKAAET